jgi:predicted dehydrogenase
MSQVGPQAESAKPKLDVSGLRQTWPQPSKPRPIVIVGAGGIVNDAHLPAYRKAGLQVAGIYDVDPERSRKTAERFAIERVYKSLGDCFEDQHTVIDVAAPPQATLDILSAVPPSATVLIQKPLGVNLDAAREIRELCREKALCAAVNFQLRFSPMMLALRHALDSGLLGDILDIEFRLQIYTPWSLFPFLAHLDRVEILVHSVHYLDWIRSVLGEPKGVYARTVGHPSTPNLNSTRTSAILDYGDRIRVCLSINHNFRSERRHQAATMTLTGSQGAAVVELGLLLNYPNGEPESLELIADGYDWTSVPLAGKWFPDAFIGTMANLQRYAAGEDDALHTSVEDAYKTMAVAEACYQSDAQGGVPIPS